MPSPSVQTRRLRRIVESVAKINKNDKNLKPLLCSLVKRAKAALSETASNGSRGSISLDYARQLASDARRKKGLETRDRVLPTIKQLRKEGYTTYRALAQKLNEMKVKPPKSQKWSAAGVRLIELRAGDT
jgi:hypothetical protein